VMESIKKIIVTSTLKTCSKMTHKALSDLKDGNKESN